MDFSNLKKMFFKEGECWADNDIPVNEEYVDTIKDLNRRYCCDREVVYVDIDGCVKGSKIGCGVWFGKDHVDNISIRCEESNATKSRAGLYAFIVALKVVKRRNTIRSTIIVRVRHKYIKRAIKADGPKNRRHCAPNDDILSRIRNMLFEFDLQCASVEIEYHRSRTNNAKKLAMAALLK